MAAVPDRAFEALADPTRRGILQLVAGDELPAGAIVQAVGAHTAISQSAISQHLKVLRDAGLLRMRAEGARRIYSVDPEGVARAAAWLDGLLERMPSFAQPLDALETELVRGRREREADAAAERKPPARTRSAS